MKELLGRYIPAAEAMRTKLKKYDGLYRQLSEEKAALEKKLASASGESRCGGEHKAQQEKEHGEDR